MNKISNQKRLAELKASLDILQEKYKLEDIPNIKKDKREILDAYHSAGIRQLIIEYINKASSRKLAKKAGLE